MQRDQIVQWCKQHGHELVATFVQHERKLKNRLQLATTRLEEAERERIWAIVAAHEAGLSIRYIAAATGLSRSRIHQLLQDHEARDIPEWLTHLRDRDIDAEAQPGTDHSAPDAMLRARIASEVEVLRWCISWLEQLEQGEMVVVNLRPDTDDQTQFTRFDHARVMCVLARITSDGSVLNVEMEPIPSHFSPFKTTSSRSLYRRYLHV